MADAAMREAGAARHEATTALVDLLDRVLSGGAVVSGDVVIALGGVDLLYLDLRLLLAPADKLLCHLAEADRPPSQR